LSLTHVRRSVDQLLAEQEETHRTPTLPAIARSVVLASMAATHPGPTLVATARTDQAEQLQAEIAAYLPPSIQTWLWSTPQSMPYEQLPFEAAAAAERVRLLAAIDRGERIVIVASARNLMHLTLSKSDLLEMTRVLKVGDRLNADAFLTWAVSVGYQRVPLVVDPGSIAQRGGVIDLYPPDALQPMRIDLFGDEIESIKHFDPASQRSRSSVLEATLLPPADIPYFRSFEAGQALRELDVRPLRAEVRAEWNHLIDRIEAGQSPAGIDVLAPWFSPSVCALLDHLPDDAQVLVDDLGAVVRAATTVAEHAEELYAGLQANRELPAGLPKPYLSPDRLEQQLGGMPHVDLGQVAEEETDDSLFVSAPLFAGRTARLVEEIQGRIDDGWAIQIASDQPSRLREMLEEHELFPRRAKSGSEDLPLPAGTIDVRSADVSGGWSLPAIKLLLLTDFEVFGYRKTPTRRGRRTVAESVAFAESLTSGEYVVHVDQGVARFGGLTRKEAGGVEREYLLLEYARGDRLYVPVEQSDRVSRYSSGGLEPKLTQLGSGEWQRAKSRVRRAVREMAFELIQLYARREIGSGIQYPPDTKWDEELAESFPYVETADQAAAIDDVRADLERERPMDRLVCGDVGFGKTEVALRAAFKVVNAGKQAAVLVPTTVLALQHFNAFSQRLAAFPVRVEMLSRLKSRSSQRTIVDGLSDGVVDVVIGTHRLVQNDIKFADLGLVVIDEEQRFGVRHKEFLKRLRTEVDVLTMSATPIPRTLHMSLAGIRDISIINTAPQDRLPIRTFVTEQSDSLIREVILRELDRGGQVYVVHNRVHSIDRFTAKLRELVPEARFGIGHGQMEEDILEDIIVGFVRHQFDVLVCTTIIESGVDIPNVNTIIIDDADKFGLTQLYQLRGRVGRGSHRAYAYLLHKPHKALSEVAEARLDAIQEATELGAGLKVALRDMEIRGAGNVLGAEQSGNIATVGYDLYIRLLSQAVEEIRQGYPTADETPLTLDLPLTALIPASYVADMELRLNTYRRVAAVRTLAELAAMREELLDRFGPIPVEVERLLALIRLRIRAEELGIQSLVEREREIVIRPINGEALRKTRIPSMLGSALRITPNSARIRMTELDIDWEEALESVLSAIESTQRS
jgi:transcription-repair coupling factor (superfamily II helicase)